MLADATLIRAGLILTATGVVSAATVRYAVDPPTGDAIFGLGFLLYLALLVVAVPRRQSELGAVGALVAVAAVYLTGASTRNANDPGLAVYIAAGALAFLATPRRFRAFAVAAVALWTPALQLFGPDPLGGFYPASLAVAAVLSLGFAVAMLLARNTLDDDERLRRIGLGLLAVACVARISERHLVVASRGALAPDDLWAFVVLAALLVVAVVPVRRTIRDALATGAALAAYVLSAMALLIGKGYHVDSVAAVHRAAEILIAGGDPYRDLDVSAALARFGLDPALATNLIDGSPVHAYNYPALSFLIPAPFIAAGLQDIRYVYLLEIVALVIVLVARARVPWRPAIVAVVVGNAVISRQNVLAGVDPFWAIATLLAFLLIARRWWSPILMGLAVASRQPAWFFAPFYVLAVWQRSGRAAALRASAIAVVVAVIPNLPFFIVAPGSFLFGVTEPLLDALEPYGVGLIRFSTDGYLPFLPRGAYAVLSIGALIGFLILLVRKWRDLPTGVLVFPSIALWLAWRSLQNYFSFAGIFALAGDEDLAAPET